MNLKFDAYDVVDKGYTFSMVFKFFLLNFHYSNGDTEREF